MQAKILTHEELEQLRHELQHDTPYMPSDEVLDLFLDNCEEIKYPNKAYVVEEGCIDPNVYLVARGIVRLGYLSGGKDVTYGFGDPGTLFLSPRSFCVNQPAHFYVASCTPCVMLRMARAVFQRLAEEHHAFSLWMMNVALFQFSAVESKMLSMTGTARERIEALLGGRLEKLMSHLERNPSFSRRQMPQQVLASYVGVTPTTYAHIRKEIIDELRAKDSKEKG